MNRQAAANPTQALFERILGWLPDWLGFVLIILAGVAAIVVGAIQPSAGLIAFGVAAIASSALAWWSGGMLASLASHILWTGLMLVIPPGAGRWAGGSR